MLIALNVHDFAKKCFLFTMYYIEASYDMSLGYTPAQGCVRLSQYITCHPLYCYYIEIIDMISRCQDNVLSLRYI